MVAYATIITEVLRFVKERAGIGTEKAGGQAAWGKAGTERRETDTEIRGGEPERGRRGREKKTDKTTGQKRNSNGQNGS